MEEPATEEATTAAVASADATEDTAEAEAETVTEDSQETAATAAATHGEAAKEPEPVAADDDGVGIPRQQSPEETADSEAADEGART
ncbi:hypothetical protein [Streptomyces rishiriensis]|uniref:hypothetical protein n=1 Tax=Streptomyces rishiriensis TaxID=68264 RepID=UPI001FEB1DD9|nr:hypothetical protein [Streptomyces rishiriensis]